MTDEEITELYKATHGNKWDFARAIIAARDEELRKQEPYAFTTGGDCREDGSIDCMAWTKGEFTKPLSAAPIPPTPSQQEIKGLVSVLRGGRQCDEDGREIIMSRQACCEAADYLESFILARPDEVKP